MYNLHQLLKKRSKTKKQKKKTKQQQQTTEYSIRFPVGTISKIVGTFFLLSFKHDM